ncbi:MAG: Mut7-C RNAse domain-containing protein [Candidatus Bathyarchaeia archaeon]
MPKREAAESFGDSDHLRFVADGMLGKLTRWLRMLGQDVKYSSSLDDPQLLMIAKKEKRILLTRDFELYQRANARGIDAFYLEGLTGEEKLAELAKRYDVRLEIDMASSRCPKCNSTVKLVSRQQAEGKVERSTFDHYKEFWKCPNCGQIYWQGAHWTRIRKTLNAAKQILEEPEREK